MPHKIDPVHVIMLRANFPPPPRVKLKSLTTAAARLKLMRAQQCADNTHLPKVAEKLLNYIKERA